MIVEVKNSKEMIGIYFSTQKFKMMVTIVNYKQREREDGTFFFALELQGGIEMIMSKSTGNFYATAKKAYISSTFDEASCKALIGNQMEGTITKEECEPYTYIVKETGEEIILTHKWVFVPEGISIEKESNTNNPFKADVEQFSKNGNVEYAQ